MRLYYEKHFPCESSFGLYFSVSRRKGRVQRQCNTTVGKCYTGGVMHSVSSIQPSTFSRLSIGLLGNDGCPDCRFLATLLVEANSITKRISHFHTQTVVERAFDAGSHVTIPA